MHIRLLRLWWLASKHDSQTVPSLHSPSPIRVKTFPFSFLIFFDKAIPQANGNPCPSEPVELSTPLILFFRMKNLKQMLLILEDQISYEK